MGIPKQVRDQANESEQLAVQHGLKDGQGKDDEVIKPVVEPKKEPPAEDWETRFKNYKSATDVTIGDLRDQLSVSQQQITESQQQVQQLIAKAQEEKPAPSSENDTSNPNNGGFDLELLPAEMREKYDDEFLVSMSSMNSIQMTQIIGDLQSRLDAAEGSIKAVEGNVENVQTTQAKSARELFYDDLDDKEPEWEKIGADEVFIAYLKNPISEFDTRPLKVVFDQANFDNDSATVLKVIAAYKQTGATVTSESNANKLDELVSPEDGNGSNNVIDDIGIHTETFTESQVKAFYSKVTKGKYSHEDAAAIEQKIQAAQQAGKILPG